jgi:signal transduction histidine kinase
MEELARKFEQASDMKVRLFVKNVSEGIGDDDKKLAVYRVVQEGLSNALKYAKTKEIFVNLIVRNRRIVLTVEDNGVGFDYDAAIKKKGAKKILGLTIMREWVSQVGGKFHIDSAPGRGTVISAEIPMED